MKVKIHFFSHMRKDDLLICDVKKIYMSLSILNDVICVLLNNGEFLSFQNVSEFEIDKE